MFRPMRRSAQQLSLEKSQEVLHVGKRGVLSVLGDHGYPYGMVMNFVYDPSQGELGSIFFHTALTGHKVDAIAACDKASFTTTDEGFSNEGEWWWYVNSAVCFGRIGIVEDSQRKHDALVILAEKYFPKDIDIEADIAQNGARIHVLELKIEHLTGKVVEEK